MTRRSMHARLTRLGNRPSAARPCKACGATIDAQGRIVGTVRWVVPPPKLLGEDGDGGDGSGQPGRMRSEREFCAGCGRLTAASLASPFAGNAEREP